MSAKEIRREEIRGLFTLGLMAVLVTLRLKLDPEYAVQFMEFKDIKVCPIIDIILVTWGLYAFFMVFGYSNDLFSSKTCNTFKEIGQGCMLLSIAFLCFIGILIVLTNPIPSLRIFAIIIFGLFLLKIPIIYRKLKKKISSR